ncbi:MAG TPA: PDDEXK nuclease domain-containing protein [Clostridiales bacterium]|nr:PDDEXK nuclease domain-containing protein [Clostridiales bacterium]
MKSEKRKFMGKKVEGVIFPVQSELNEMPESYIGFFKEIKQKVLKERLKTIISANSAMILLYWDIGRSILISQENEGWGSKVIDRLSFDLRKAFPEMSGFSPRNLKYMRKFAEEWPDKEIVQRTVAQIPWRSNITLLDKLKDQKLRLWYAQRTIEKGFGKDMLAFQIETKLHLREGSSLNNFNKSLPPKDSDMTAQIFKDPYVFDFLGTDDPRRENELEQKLIDNIQNFLIELGQGFAFVGRQVHLEAGGSDFYIDLLFYHLMLRCYVVIELKAGKFEPGYISKLNMYQNIVNDVLRHPEDKKTIGLLLVRSKSKMIVEYSLAGYKNPIGVANWEKDITRTLPDEFAGILPTIEEIESGIK